ncbi:hypothetical protein D3C80_2113810 [compost metagenome]
MMYCMASETIIRKVAMDGITLMIVEMSPMKDHFFRYWSLEILVIILPCSRK